MIGSQDHNFIAVNLDLMKVGNTDYILADPPGSYYLYESGMTNILCGLDLIDRK